MEEEEGFYFDWQVGLLAFCIIFLYSVAGYFLLSEVDWPNIFDFFCSFFRKKEKPERAKV